MNLKSLAATNLWHLLLGHSFHFCSVFSGLFMCFWLRFQPVRVSDVQLECKIVEQLSKAAHIFIHLALSSSFFWLLVRFYYYNYLKFEAILPWRSEFFHVFFDREYNGKQSVPRLQFKYLDPKTHRKWARNNKTIFAVKLQKTEPLTAAYSTGAIM